MQYKILIGNTYATDCTLSLSNKLEEKEYAIDSFSWKILDYFKENPESQNQTILDLIWKYNDADLIKEMENP